jgi:hypothetical protein
MRVWLTRKLAESIDDVNLSGRQVGDVLDLSGRDASLLLAEQWALPDRRGLQASEPATERRRSNLRNAHERGEDRVRPG